MSRSLVFLIYLTMGISIINSNTIEQKNIADTYTNMETLCADASGNSDRCVANERRKRSEQRFESSSPLKVIADAPRAGPAYKVSENTVDSMGVGIGKYDETLYPYAHSKLFAVLNVVPPVSRLPPVYTTHIRESLPRLMTNYPYIAPVTVRLARDSDDEEDFLDQLSHDAMMVNILPTMPVPFVRSSIANSYSTADEGNIFAVYPGDRHRSNCAMPLLFFCTPKISRGVLSTPAKPVNVYQDREGTMAVHKAIKQHGNKMGAPARPEK